MTEKELLSLKKSELLEIMLAQSREIDSLRAQLEEAKAELADKRINIEQSGPETDPDFRGSAESRGPLS